MSTATVVMLTFQGGQILDVTGPQAVFSTASRLVSGASYSTEIVSMLGGPVTASCGFQFATSPVVNVAGEIDTLIATGEHYPSAISRDDQPLVAEVLRLADRARRVAAVSSGAFLLAAAGLLEGRRATTHWEQCALLDRHHPGVDVVADALHVRDGHVWTSAGATASIDLALALVVEDHGRPAAVAVARQVLAYLQRSGGQNQYAQLEHVRRSADDEAIDELLTRIPERLSEELTTSALASEVGLSERQFRRVFTQQVGTTPVQHVESVRLAAACHLLETTPLPVGEIAARCGFGTPETMNRAFRRRLNTTPLNHRRHFGGDAVI